MPAPRFAPLCAALRRSSLPSSLKRSALVEVSARAGATLRAPALSSSAARGMPPVDWWLALESNVEDVAAMDVVVTLLRKPAAAVPPCYFSRFCPDYTEPHRRYSQGERDASDPWTGESRLAAPMPDRSGGARSAYMHIYALRGSLHSFLDVREQEPWQEHDAYGFLPSCTLNIPHLDSVGKQKHHVRSAAAGGGENGEGAFIETNRRSP